MGLLVRKKIKERRVNKNYVDEVMLKQITFLASLSHVSSSLIVLVLL